MVSRRKPATLGVPIWKNGDLIADIDNPQKADIADAERFADSTAEKLGLSTEYVLPAFEDPGHWLQREASLPSNVDPSDSKLADPEERARMARVFDQGLNTPKGFVLPIQRWNAEATRWRSEKALRCVEPLVEHPRHARALFGVSEFGI